MTESPAQASPKIPPKWTVVAFLIGALSSFVGAFLAFSFNGAAALLFAFIALVSYIAGGIGYARAPRRGTAVQDEAPKVQKSRAWLAIASMLAFASVLIAGLWMAATPSGTPAATGPLATTVATELAAEEQDTLAQGDAAFERGDYAHALELYKPLAERGNGYAQAMLSRIYAGQPGMPTDNARALEWAHAGADRGDPEGLLALASLHYAGDVLPKDLPKAADLVEQAANTGHASAQAELGRMYAQGEGREQSATVAREWLSMAAKQGQWNAQILLGRLTLNEGTSLGADLPMPNIPSEDARRAPVPEAVVQSAQAGDADAKLEVARDLYAAALRDVTDVPQEVVDLVEQAAASGHVMAQFAAGALHTDGFHGIPNDPAAAKAWFDKGVAQLP